MRRPAVDAEAPLVALCCGAAGLLLVVIAVMVGGWRPFLFLLGGEALLFTAVVAAVIFAQDLKRVRSQT